MFTQPIHICTTDYQRRLDTYAAHVIVRWTRSDSARVIACFTFLPQQRRPMSIWPGTKGKRANVMPSTLKPALWSTFLHGADGWRQRRRTLAHCFPGCDRSFHRLLCHSQPYSQNDLGVEQGWLDIQYSDSTPLALSNDTNSFGVIEKSTEKILIVFLVQKPP